MAYQLSTKERPGPGLRRVAREELTCALAEIQSGRQSGEVLHEVRKRLKKLRAALRRAGKQSAGRSQTGLAALFRKASRRIAALRDAQVQAGAFKKLAEQCRNAAARELCLSLQSAMISKTSRAGTARPLREVTVQLKEAALLLENWPSEDLGWPTVWSAWKNTRRKYFKLMKRAIATLKTESLHEWRKSTKTWWYQTLLLEVHARKKNGKLLRRLEVLSEQLGADHDLALLEQTLRKSKSPASSTIRPILKKQRLRLQKKAISLGLKLADF